MANKSNAISEEELSGVNGGVIEHRIEKGLFGFKKDLYVVHDNNTGKVVKTFYNLNDAKAYDKGYNGETSVYEENSEEAGRWDKLWDSKKQ